MRISDWSSDVCSSDLIGAVEALVHFAAAAMRVRLLAGVQVIDPRPNREGISAREGDDDLVLRRVVGDKAVGVCARGVEGHGRSEESRVGKEGFSTCGSRWSPCH